MHIQITDCLWGVSFSKTDKLVETVVASKVLTRPSLNLARTSWFTLSGYIFSGGTPMSKSTVSPTLSLFQSFTSTLFAGEEEEELFTHWCGSRCNDTNQDNQHDNPQHKKRPLVVAHIMAIKAARRYYGNCCSQLPSHLYCSGRCHVCFGVGIANTVTGYCSHECTVERQEGGQLYRVPIPPEHYRAKFHASRAIVLVLRNGLAYSTSFKLRTT